VAAGGLARTVAAAAAACAAWASATPAAARGDVEDPMRVGGLLGALDARAEVLRAAGADVLAALPRLPAELAAAVGRIADDAPWGPLQLLLVIAAAAASAAAMLLVRARLRGVAGRAAEAPWAIRGAAAAILCDAAERLAFAGVALAATGLLFGGGTLGEQLGVAALWALVRTGLILLAADAALRPQAARLRLLPVSDDDARRLRAVAAAALLVGVGGISVVPVLLRAGLAIEHAQALALTSGNAAAAIAAAGIVGLDRAMRGAGDRAARVRRVVVAGAWTCLAVVAVSWTVGVLLVVVAPFHDFVAAVAAVGAGAAAVGALSLPAPAEAGMRTEVWRPVLRRLAASAALAAAGIQASQALALYYLQITDPAAWADARASLVRCATVLVLGYAGWEAFSRWTAARIAEAAPHGPGADDDAEPGRTSRLATVLPLARTLGGAVMAVTLLFLVLSELGVDTAPLIAGAGILGLAVSFGSQALVKDVVSGVFFMVEDAFRVGEYIQAGELRGTVERIQTRSIRVRHQSGHLHTIPFGQLDTVTNLSRDWTTMRFEIRLARDVDLETVRRTVKRIGLEMLTDPELGKDFILPMKLQGVKDVAEHALICRVKFTVRPVRPFWIQREALKRIIAVFRQEGIPFASNQVVVQGGEPAAAAAALRGRAGPAAVAAPDDGPAGAAAGPA
jgi:small-conductance mechanosensitive channel